MYKKVTRDLAIANALCSYNHVPEEEYMNILGKFATIKDEKIGVSFMTASQAVLNLIPGELVEDELKKFTHQEYISVGNHEQYYYSDYYAYQPDYVEKILTMGRVLKDAGFEFIFMEDLPH